MKTPSEIRPTTEGWSPKDRRILVQRLRARLHHERHRLDLLPIPNMWTFLGYDRETYLQHMAARHRQGCLACGGALDPRPVIFHITPVSAATSGATLRIINQLRNIGFAHDRCNRHLGNKELV